MATTTGTGPREDSDACAVDPSTSTSEGCDRPCGLDDDCWVTMTPRPLRRPARPDTSPLRPRVCFIRHAETDWNAEERLLSRTNVPLNATGEAQVLGFNIGRPDDVGRPR
jgi:hypothetical protein